VLGRLAAVALCAFALAGCASTQTQPLSTAEVRLPEPALLRPPRAPNCEAKAQPGPSDPAAERAKLDYERQCYQHAELIVRDRLERLQGAVGETINSIRSSERGAAQH
jgi:hypothetical protein